MTIRRSHLISVARRPEHEALRCDGGRTPAPRAPETRWTMPSNSPVASCDHPSYAIRALGFGSTQDYCSICGAREENR